MRPAEECLCLLERYEGGGIQVANLGTRLMEMCTGDRGGGSVYLETLGSLRKDQLSSPVGLFFSNVVRLE